MKKDLNRALNAFDAMNTLPDDLILDAERALLKAETGIAITPKPQGGFARFLNSGWGVAAVSCMVAVAVLVAFLLAGRLPAPQEPSTSPPANPSGSTIEMSPEGARYTLSVMQGSYAEGDTRITVIITGKSHGETISPYNSWHLERLTDKGAEVVPIYYTEEAISAIRPAKDAYATAQKSINLESPLTEGHYRLHSTKHDGEKYVSVAYCTFTVGDPGDLTWENETEMPPEVETEPAVEYPPATDRPYTISTSETFTYGTWGIGITVTAAEQGEVLRPHRVYKIIKLAGPTNTGDGIWLQNAEDVEVHPTEENGGYAVYRDSLTFPTEERENWLPGLYRLYALNHNEEYIDYCDFVIKGDHSMPHEMFLAKKVYTTADTELQIQILGLEKGQIVGWHEGWSLYALNGNERELVGSGTPIEIAYESLQPADDEFILCDVTKRISVITEGRYQTLPTGQYELVYRHGSDEHRMPFTVVDASDASFELAFPDFRISMSELAYLYDRPNGVVVNRGIEDPGPPEHITDESLPATRTLTVDGQELTLTYWYTESRNDPSDTDLYIYTQPGHAEGEWSILAIYPHGSDQLSRINYRCRDGFLLNGLPTTRNTAKEVADARVKELMGSLPRSSDYLYDANSKRHTVTYHNTASLINTASVSIYKLLNADIVQIAVSFPRYDEEKIKADIGDMNVDLLTASLKDYLTRYYKDSSVTFEGLKEGVYATEGPRFHYTMTVTVEGREQDVTFYVYRDGPNDDLN